MSETVTGAQKLAQRLRTLRSYMGDIVSDSQVESLLLRRMKQRTERGVDADGVPFVPLAASTIRKKRRMEFLARKPESVLFESGRLFKSIQVVKRTETELSSPTGGGFSIGIDPRDKRSQRVGREHQLGLRNLPKRRFLGVNRLDVKAADSLLRRAMNRRIKKANLA